MNARARLRSSRQGGQAATPDNLIHRNKVPNPMPMRATARFDFPAGVPVGVLFEALKLPFPLAVEVLRRATR